jgi:hypothetical protein
MRVHDQEIKNAAERSNEDVKRRVRQVKQEGPLAQACDSRACSRKSMNKRSKTGIGLVRRATAHGLGLARGSNKKKEANGEEGGVGPLIACL